MSNEEKKFIELISKIPNVAVQGYNKQREVIYWNEASENIYGYSREEALGQNLEDLIIPSFMQSTVISHIENWHKSGIAIPAAELPLQHKNGTTVYVYSSHIMLNEHTQNPEMFCVDVNLTEQKKLESTIKNKNLELENIFNSYDFAVRGSNDGLWDWDIKNNTMFLSKRWKEMLGFQENELENCVSTWKKLIHPKDYDYCMEYIDDALKEKNGSFEKKHRLKHKNGSWIWVLDRGKTFFDEEGKPIRMAGFHTDITDVVKKDKEIKEKERMLLHQSKLASMGEMLANIAHQWRQPLSSISTLATGTKIEKEMDLLTDDKLLCALDSINETTQHLSRTIDDFKNFYAPKKKKVTIFKIIELISKTLKLVSSQIIINDIHITKNITNFEIQSLEGELVQVLMNIISNAKDALLNVEGYRLIEINSYTKDNKGVIEIIDNAKGIDKKIVNKIFDPYFTTKHSTQGTGLGLYMSEEIVTKHLKGTITVENINFEKNGVSCEGAKFTISLPLI